MCYREVLVSVSGGNGSSFLYGEVTPERVKRIVAEHIVAGSPVEEWLVSGPDRETGFFDKQQRIVLRNCGIIDPARYTSISRKVVTKLLRKR